MLDKAKCHVTTPFIKALEGLNGNSKYIFIPAGLIGNRVQDLDHSISLNQYIIKFLRSSSACRRLLVVVKYFLYE